MKHVRCWPTQFALAANVAFWHKADVPIALSDVCFQGAKQTSRGHNGMSLVHGNGYWGSAPANLFKVRLTFKTAFVRWANSYVAGVEKEISFYSEQLGKQISSVYSISGRMLIVISSDGRQKCAPLGGSSPEILARLTLIESE